MKEKHQWLNLIIVLLKPIKNIKFQSKHFLIIKKYSILSLNPQSSYYKHRNTLTFDIYEIYLFNKSGALIAENFIENNIYNQDYYKKVFPNLIQSTALCDKKRNNLINHNIYFLKQRKIITLNLGKTNVIALAVCANETKSKLVYFFLLKVIMSYLNYLKMHNCTTTYNIHSIIYETIFLSPIKNHYSLAIR